MNGYVFKSGVSLVEYLCEVYDGTGEIWINDDGTKEPCERLEQTSRQYLTVPKIEEQGIQPGDTIGMCRSCSRMDVIDTNCHCKRYWP